MQILKSVILAFALCVASACSKVPSSPQREVPVAIPAKPAPPAARAPSFVNRVWRVRRSSAVGVGTQYVFRSDGTLLITSPHSKPLVGSWSRAGDGLSMVEESIPYRVEILRLTDDVFEIRSHNPGTPVDIEMVPAPVEDKP